jgi:hypothetical protein
MTSIFPRHYGVSLSASDFQAAKSAAGREGCALQHRAGGCGCRGAIGRLRREALLLDGFDGTDRAVLASVSLSSTAGAADAFGPFQQALIRAPMADAAA